MPACLTCHDWKDRTPLADWPADLVLDIVQSLPPGMSRVLIGKLHAVAMDGEAER